MINTKPRCVCVLLLAFLIHVNYYKDANAQLELGEITEVLQFGREVLSDVLESWEFFSSLNETADDNVEMTDYLFTETNEKKLMNKISALSSKIDKFEESAEIRALILFEKLSQEIHEETLLVNQLHELNDRIERVSRNYLYFKHYASAPEKYERFTLEEFVTWCVSPSEGIPEILEELHNVIVPDQDGFGSQNLLTLLAENLKEEATTICNEQQSPQQLLHDLYNSIAVTEIKGYAMIQFSLMLLSVYKQGNFTYEKLLAKDRYETRMSETLKAVKTAMAVASQDLWRCDAPYPIGNESYTELTWFLQSYIVNEVDLNTDNTCKEDCGHYQNAVVSGCYDGGNEYCSQQRKCSGSIYNCQYIDWDMRICPAERSSGRRYNYIEYGNGRVFGQKETCSQGTTKVESWHRWIFWRCSYCVCFCDDYASDSDRYFNLREVVADIAANKVITGIKFVKVNRTIHLQIEQGTLLKRGKIANNTEWKPVESYSVLNSSLKNGVDYFTLSWGQRAVDLDDLTVPPGYLLTGVRFRSLGYHINLEIMSTPFNFTTGQLNKTLETSLWHGNNNTAASKSNPRTILGLTVPDRSTRSGIPSIPDSKSDQFILFTPTDLEKDAAQSTVPFIDTQTVAPYPRIPIAGAGIYHKGRQGFGGYIAPKLKTYNFSPHLHIDHSVADPVIKFK